MRTLIDFSQQRSTCLGVATDDSTHQETLSAVESVVSKKSIRANTQERPKFVTKVKIEPTTPKAEELPIAIENERILCNFEFACYLSRFAQKFLAATVLSPCNLASHSQVLSHRSSWGSSDGRDESEESGNTREEKAKSGKAEEDNSLWRSGD